MLIERRKMNPKAELTCYNTSAGVLPEPEAKYTIMLLRLLAVHVNGVLPVNEITVYNNICIIAVLPSH
jgi:hypothetical protein